MANINKYQIKSFDTTQAFLATDESGSAVRVTGQSMLDANIESLKASGKVVNSIDTLTEAIAGNYQSGIYLLVGGGTVTLDGDQAIYRVSDAGSGGIVMANGNELVLLFVANTPADIVTPIANVSALFGLTGVAGQQISVGGYQVGSIVGGGTFSWGSGIHNGGTFIDPTRAWPNWAVPAEVTAWYLNTGLTVSGWERGSFNDIYANMFGAYADGASDDWAAIQKSLDICNLTGKTILLLVADHVHITSKTILQPSNTIIASNGKHATIKLANGSDVDVIQSTNFSTLTGTNSWDISAGVGHEMGFRNIIIDGNKANQTTGRGVCYYAKGIVIDDLIITECFSNGLLTECGLSPSVNLVNSLPEGEVSRITLHKNGGHGWLNRGPHDLYIGKITSLLNDGDGYRMETSATYLATADIDMIHCYANGGKGGYFIGSTARISDARFEDSGDSGLVLDDSDLCSFSLLQVANTCKTTGDAQISILSNCSYVNIGKAHVRYAGQATVKGIFLAGSYCDINAIIRGNVFGGANSTSVGFDLANNALSNSLNIIVSEYAAGTALRTGHTLSVSRNRVNGTLMESGTLWDNVNLGSNNIYTLNGKCSPGDALFAGVGLRTLESEKDQWNVTLYNSDGSAKLSKQHLVAGVDLNITTEQVLTINHDLVITPDLKNVQAALYSGGTNTVFNVQYIKVSSVTATQIVVKLKLLTAAGAVQTGNVVVHANV